MEYSIGIYGIYGNMKNPQDMKKLLQYISEDDIINNH